MIKRFVFTVLVLFLAFEAVYAFQTTVWNSSNSAVNISTTALCTETGATGIRGVLHGVCINTAAAGSVQVFNSSGSATNPITGVYSTATQVPCNFYDVAVTSNISVNHNGTADITVLFQCY